MLNWHNKLEERQMEEKLKRNPYQWGAKGYLLSLKEGEVRKFDNECDWNHLASVASNLKRDLGCRFVLSSMDGEKYVIRIH